jgi:hypothetical protein
MASACAYRTSVVLASSHATTSDPEQNFTSSPFSVQRASRPVMQPNHTTRAAMAHACTYDFVLQLKALQKVGPRLHKGMLVDRQRRRRLGHNAIHGCNVALDQQAGPLASHLDKEVAYFSCACVSLLT